MMTCMFVNRAKLKTKTCERHVYLSGIFGFRCSAEANGERMKNYLRSMNET